jgi:hypothetical protein
MPKQKINEFIPLRLLFSDANKVRVTIRCFYTDNKQRQPMQNNQFNIVSRTIVSSILIIMLTAIGLNASVSEVNNLSTPDLQSALNQNSDTILINVLPKIIFDNRHIKGSINVPLGQLASINEIVKEKNAPIIFYCMGRL